METHALIPQEVPEAARWPRELPTTWVKRVYYGLNSLIEELEERGTSPYGWGLGEVIRAENQTEALQQLSIKAEGRYVDLGMLFRELYTPLKASSDAYLLGTQLPSGRQPLTQDEALRLMKTVQERVVQMVPYFPDAMEFVLGLDRAMQELRRGRFHSSVKEVNALLDLAAARIGALRDMRNYLNELHDVFDRIRRRRLAGLMGAGEAEATRNTVRAIREYMRLYHGIVLPPPTSRP